jgi:hypothetical protein
MLLNTNNISFQGVILHLLQKSNHLAGAMLVPVFLTKRKTMALLMDPEF